MKKHLLSGMAVMIVLAGCQKAGDLDKSPDNAEASASPYFPVTKGNYWKFKYADGSPDQTGTLTGEKTTNNGITYYEIATTPVEPAINVKGYIGIKEHKYYSWAKGTAKGFPVDQTTLFLNDTASVNFEWSFDGGITNGFPSRGKGKIIERGMTVSFEGKTYKDVIHTQVEFEFNFPMIGWTTATISDYYVAKNIGTVRTTVDAAIGSSALDQLLIDYKVN